jgi:ribonuclease BN (tRNA processing enzyme)
MTAKRSLSLRSGFLGFMIAFMLVGWFLYFQGKVAFERAEQVRYLETRNFEEFTVVTVGTAGSTENPSRRGPAVAVGFGETLLLVDAGRAVSEGLRNAKIPVQQPDTVYLSSLLPENTVGLDDLLLTGWRAPREIPLRVVGPKGTRALTENLIAAHRQGIATESLTQEFPALGATFEIVEIDADWSEQRGDLQVQVLALQGGPYSALAYRFSGTQEGKVLDVVVSSAQWDRARLVEFSRRAWAMVLQGYSERSVEAAIEADTNTPEELEQLKRSIEHRPTLGASGGLAQDAGVYKLIFVRLSPPPIFDRPLLKEIHKEFTGVVVLAEDGEEITP